MSRRDGHGHGIGSGTALAKILPNHLCLLTIDNNTRFLRLSPTCISITNKHVIQ